MSVRMTVQHFRNDSTTRVRRAPCMLYHGVGCTATHYYPCPYCGNLTRSGANCCPDIRAAIIAAEEKMRQWKAARRPWEDRLWRLTRSLELVAVGFGVVWYILALLDVREALANVEPSTTDIVFKLIVAGTVSTAMVRIRSIGSSRVAFPLAIVNAIVGGYVCSIQTAGIGMLLVGAMTGILLTIVGTVGGSIFEHFLWRRVVNFIVYWLPQRFVRISI